MYDEDIENNGLRELIEKAGLDEGKYTQQMDHGAWPQLTEDLRDVFRSKKQGSISYFIHK